MNVKAEKRYNLAKRALSTLNPRHQGAWSVATEHVNAGMALKRKHGLRYTVNNNVLNRIVKQAKRNLRFKIIKNSPKLPAHILKKIANSN
jgi:hypothetical protein